MRTYNRFEVLSVEPKNVNKQTTNDKPQYNTRFDALMTGGNEYKKQNYRNNNRDNRDRNPLFQKRYNNRYMTNKPEVITKPEFNLSKDKLINEFPSLNNKDIIETTKFSDEFITYQDKVKVEKVVIPDKKYIKPSDVRSIVNEYYLTKKPLEPRVYDKNGWMENEDWIEWYEENKFNLDQQLNYCY